MWSLGLESMLVVHGADYGNRARGLSYHKRQLKEINSSSVFLVLYDLYCGGAPYLMFDSYRI